MPSRRFDFKFYHTMIEKSIAEAFKNENEKGFDEKRAFIAVNSVIGTCAEDLANELLAYRYKRNPELKGKIDQVWLRIHVTSLITAAWASAVSRGKSIDRKRERKGREGWAVRHAELLAELRLAYESGEEIANDRLFHEGDMDVSVPMARLRKGLQDFYK